MSEQKAKGKGITPRKVFLVIIVGAIAAYGVQRWRIAHSPYEWSGTVEAHTISVGSRAGGRIKDILVREGDHVTAGQPIITIEPSDWPAQVAQAQAQLAQAQANLDKLKAGARPEEIAQARARTQATAAALQETVTGARPEEIAAAQARLVAQQVAVEKAQHDADRQHKLASAGAAVAADVDNAEIALKGAIAQRDALKQQLDELKVGSRREDLAQARARQAEQAASEKLVDVGPRSEDIRAAQAQVDGAQGRVEQLKVMVDELTIRAPRAARIEALDLRPGDILGPNQSAAILLEDGELYVRIYVPETRLGLIKPGQVVPITVDSFPDKSFSGTVEHINDVGEYSPRNLQTADERADQVFATRVRIDKGIDQLRAGMAAFIQVPHD